MVWASSTIVSIVNAIPLVRTAAARRRSARQQRAPWRLWGAAGAGATFGGDAFQTQRRRLQGTEAAHGAPVVHSQLPKVMELVGLSYSSWFVYRYLLFKARAGVWPLSLCASGKLCICHPCTRSRREAGRRPCWPGSHGTHKGAAVASGVAAPPGRVLLAGERRQEGLASSVAP